MGKPTLCLGENKGADQLRGNREAGQRLCFRYSDGTIPPLLNSKISCFCACTARFVSDLFGNHIVGFPTRWLLCMSRDICMGMMKLFEKILVYKGMKDGWKNE